MCKNSFLSIKCSTEIKAATQLRICPSPIKKKNFFTYLKGRMTQREISHLLVYSLKAHSGQGWIRSQLAARSSIWSPKSEPLLLLLSVHICRTPDHKQRRWDRNWPSSVRCTGVFERVKGGESLQLCVDQRGPF